MSRELPPNGQLRDEEAREADMLLSIDTPGKVLQEISRERAAAECPDCPFYFRPIVEPLVAAGYCDTIYKMRQM